MGNRVPKIEIKAKPETYAVVDDNYEIDAVTYRDHYYWRLKGTNGEIVCVSETFTRKSDAKRAARRAVVLMSKAVIDG